MESLNFTSHLHHCILNDILFGNSFHCPLRLNRLRIMLRWLKKISETGVEYIYISWESGKKGTTIGVT